MVKQARLAKETKAVLRELRRHDRAVEQQLERIANAVTEIMFVATNLDVEDLAVRAGREESE